MSNHQNIELEQEEDLVLDPESDDSEASDILELIERESSEAAEPEAPNEHVPVVKAPAEDFALESLYFRSFGERPLLKREEEVALAKRIDQGSRAIRAVLREAVALASKMRKGDLVVDAVQQVNEVRHLSGFSATALDTAERILATLVKEARQHRAGGYREKQLSGAFGKFVMRALCRKARKMNWCGAIYAWLSILRSITTAKALACSI